MIEIQCPFCDENCRMDAAEFSAERCSLRCDGCSVVVEFDRESAPIALALAA